jgi:hypothetical protein
MKSSRLASWAFLAASSLLGCADDSTSDDAPPGPELRGAKGVTIREVAIYQSVKRTILRDGALVEDGVPIIAGRPAVVRVFYETSADYDGEEVVARLTVDGDAALEQTATLAATSTDPDLGSTLNFTIPGDRIGSELSFSIGLLQESTQGQASAQFPADGTQPVAVTGAKNVFRIQLLPVSYEFDGSSRLPEITEEILGLYRERLMQLYPVSDVEITVRDPYSWNGEIHPYGYGWEEILDRLFTLRSQYDVPDDTYLYGIFDPAPNFGQYCSEGCVTGLTYLNTQPAGPGEVAFRFGTGVGYPQVAFDTSAHELGHAHGRGHADCGGADPSTIDPDFPHDNGIIGAWGMDTATMTLYAPDQAHDLMSYCEPAWVSDYQFTALSSRASFVNQASWHAAPGKQRVAMVHVDGRGKAKFGGFATSPVLFGRRVSTIVKDGEGRTRSGDAAFFAYDHLPGGTVFVTVGDEDASSVQLELDGVRYEVGTAE